MTADILLSLHIMIIYNTTYNASNDKAIAFVKWLRTRYIPFATESGELKEARLAHLMVENDGKSNSFSLQFTVENVDVLEKWYHKYGASLLHEMETTFGQKVVGFTTIMTVMDIEYHNDQL